jgi:hypothetical protein
MTTTRRRSSALDFSPRRRSLLLGGLGSAAALATLGRAGIAAAQPAAAPTINFDFDNGNFIRDLLEGQDPRGILDVIAPMDATIIMWSSHMIQTSWFDAIAPYHPTAVGLYSRIPRRPASESATNRNKNIAALHAMYQTLKGVVPARTQDSIPGLNFRDLLVAVGLNPDDESEDPTSPVGIGNLAGKGVVKHAQHDGMNLLGFQGRKYNPMPFADYTGYRPVNTAFELIDPSRWQPQLGPHFRRLGQLKTGGPGDRGIFVVQHFVTPQLRLTKPVAYKHPGQFHLAPPDFSDANRRSAYKRSVDDMLSVSAALTDEQKVKAEIFDDKERGIAAAVFTVAHAHDHELGLDGWVHLFATSAAARLDSAIASWHQKAKYDAVRPVSAIQHVYGNRPVTSWGGPGAGRVTDMPAGQWASYLNVSDHPEYPSGSTGLCSAEAQALRRFFGSDTLDLTVSVPAGWTLVESGITPAEPLTIHWETWTEFVRDCAISRVWGGVHFRKTVERSIPFGEQFGDRAYELVQRHIRGEVDN